MVLETFENQKDFNNYIDKASFAQLKKLAYEISEYYYYIRPFTIYSDYQKAYDKAVKEDFCLELDSTKELHILDREESTATSYTLLEYKDLLKDIDFETLINENF